MTNTNFLTDGSTADIFLTEGAFVQTSADRFKIFVGPFSTHSSYKSALEKAQSMGLPVVYSPQFWDFLHSDSHNIDYSVPSFSFNLDLSGFKQFLNGAAENKSIAEHLQWSEQDVSQFQTQFSWIQKSIVQQRISKALPISLALGAGDVAARKKQILMTLLSSASANYAYGSWNSHTGMIGYTPEILSSWDQESAELRTMALAGTWKKSSIDHTSDFTDEKNQAEHRFVITDIEKQLSSYNLKYKSETTVIELPYLYHLKTNFIYQCDQLTNFKQAVRLLHPTAALGMYPRDPQSLNEFSKINLQTRRKQFGAPFGFFHPDEAFILVAIRNILWSEDQVQLFAGCGVTAKSVFEEEWSEILAKQESVKKMLGILN